MDNRKISGFYRCGFAKDFGKLRAYAYLILSSQASARSSIIGNTASSLTAQSAFLNNFENIVNLGVDIREDIKRYQNTLSYKLSKVDYSVGESIYMITSDMNLKIRLGTVGYNNKILVSDGKFNLGKNKKVNLAVPAMKSHKTNSIDPTTITASQGLTHAPAISQKNQKPVTHNEEKNCFGAGSGRWFCNMEYV